MAEFIGQPFFSCRYCRNPLAAREDILSKRFWGKTGPAYLFRNVTNVAMGRTEDRKLITGVYSVANIHCRFNVCLKRDGPVCLLSLI